MHQVVVECGGGFGQFARFKQLQDLDVHLHIRGVEELGVVEQAKCQAQFGQQMGEHGVQPLAVGQLHDGHVELHVGGAHALPVGVVAACLPGLYGAAHVLDGGVAGVGLGHRLTLYESAHPVDVNDGGDAGHGDRHAPVGLMAQQTLFGQQPEYFAQRVARDLQVLAECGLRQPLAGREFPMHDFLAHLLGNAVREIEQGVRRAGHGAIEGACGHPSVSAAPAANARRAARSLAGRVVGVARAGTSVHDMGATVHLAGA